MSKKKTGVLFISIAYILLLGHNVIPHHHHYDNDFKDNPHFQHHQGLKETCDFDYHFFSHIIHIDSGFCLTANQHISKSFFNQYQPLAILSVLGFSFNAPLSYSFFRKPAAEPAVFISQHVLSVGLRAPPVILL